MKIADSELFGKLANFIKTEIFSTYVHLPHQTIGLFTGNQSMKTCSTAYQYVLRILSIHPVPKKNVLYFECTGRKTVDDLSKQRLVSKELSEEYEATKKKYLSTHTDMDSATFTLPLGMGNGNVNDRVYPKDLKCPECGEKVIIYKRDSNVFRFASENLPTEKGSTGSQSTEIKNAQYPEFKKWLPECLIVRDISQRNPAMTLKNIHKGLKVGDEVYDGHDILVEFVSYSQTVKSSAGVQRMSIWEDEEPPFDFHEEQIPRLMAEDGDIVITVTPADGMSWTYDDIFEKSSVYHRTKAICDYLSIGGKKVKMVEHTGSGSDIAVIQAATDDNPTLSPDRVEAYFDDIPDPDGTVKATRRYGVFKQATGRIFKDFMFNTHVINGNVVNKEVMKDWTHGRAIDFHEANPWAIVWAAISPTNEAFVYKEFMPSPDKWITDTIAQEVAKMSGDQKFSLNLIDALANKKQTNTGKTTVEDLNKQFLELRKKELCSGGYWEPWNSKGTVGRDEIKKRLSNSAKVGKPFNNEVYDKINKKFLPTLWILAECKETIRSIKHWRLDVWANNRQLTTKDRKETPAAKFSHFCTSLEALFKDRRFRARTQGRSREHHYKYFRGR